MLEEAAKSDLPMDRESQLRRAVEMGFDLTTYYHGTPHTKQLDKLQRGHWQRIAGQPFYLENGSQNPDAMIWIPSERQMVKVKFSRGDMLSYQIIYYDEARGLKARGIQMVKPSKKKYQKKPDAFPAMSPEGCSPPPDWRG